MKRIAIVGVGSMGKNHVRVSLDIPDIELAAVVDSNLSVAENIGRTYRVPAYDDYRTMFEQEKPDAVSIAVPTQYHYDVAKYFLKAGCNVLVEKPIAATIEQAEELVNLADQSGCVFMVGHIERYNPAIIELKRRLDQGELGRVYQIHARRLGPFPPRIQDVGVVMDLATHDLDIMRYLTGSEVMRVFAETNRELHASREDLFVGTLRFSNGIVGLLELNWLTPTKIRELYVTGERGMFRANYITQDLCFFENAEIHTGSARSFLQGVSEGSMVQYAIQKREPLRVELESFFAQLHCKDLALNNGNDAKEALSLASALVESAYSGQVREVNGHENTRITTKPPASKSSKRALPIELPAYQAGD